MTDADLGFVPLVLSALAAKKAANASGGGTSNGPARKPVLTLTRKQQDKTFNAAFAVGKGILALVLLGGTVWGGRYLYLKARANRETNKALDDSNPSSYATLIHLAIAGPGTDEQNLRNAFVRIPNHEFWKRIIKSYKAQYGGNIVKDLQDDLGLSEFREFMAIVNSKKDLSPVQRFNYWADRLQAAFDYTFMLIPQTDEEAIYAVFRELPNRKSFALLAMVYERKFGKPLESQMRSELDGEELKEVAAIYQSKSN